MEFYCTLKCLCDFRGDFSVVCLILISEGTKSFSPIPKSTVSFFYVYICHLSG